MATIKIQGNASGSGTLIIEAPNTNSARTLTLPDAAGELLTATGDGSGLTGISSGAGSNEAWVNFNGVGAVAVRNSGNVSSITDYGTGYYGTNFSTAMSSSTYAASLSASDNTTGGQTAGYAYGSWLKGSISYSTSQFRFRVGWSGNSSAYDQEFVNVVVVE